MLKNIFKSTRKSRQQKIRLGVNLDHIATLRQVRASTTAYPSLEQAAREVVRAGAEQITIHLREDRRHIQDKDVQLLCRLSLCEMNLEMAASSEMLKIAIKNRPDWVCLVPEKRAELTTEGGLDVAKKLKYYTNYVKQLSDKHIACSMFIEANIKQVEASAKAGAKAVEFHTGHWVLAKGAKRKALLKKLVAASVRAHELGLYVHAGHGLDYDSTKEILSLPYLRELNIGHSIVCHSVFEGLYNVVSKFNSILKSK